MTWEVINKMQEAHFEVSGDPDCQLQDTHPRHPQQNLDLSLVF